MSDRTKYRIVMALLVLSDFVTGLIFKFSFSVFASLAVIVGCWIYTEAITFQ